MAYEKYIKKDGKLYGPYIYHSRRIDGKVVSEYHGQKNLWHGKFLWIIPMVLLVIFGAYLIGQKGNKTTGYSVLDLNANYQEGQTLEGGLKLSLREGELIPVSSSVVFENAGKEYEYPLKDLVSESTSEGNFFIQGKNISGSGLGFGILGIRDIYPEVYFILLIYSPKENQTGDGITESEREVQGSVSSGNTFTYMLQEGERAELKPRSVRTASGQLSEDSVSLAIEGNLVSISTNYSEKEEGFGISYIGSGEKIKELTINLNELNLFLEKGDLKVGVFYEGEEIVSLQTTVGEGDVSAQEPAPIGQSTTEQITTASVNENANDTNITEAEFSIIIPTAELTTVEISVLEKEFGNISLEVKETKTRNGFIIIRYELREDTWVNYSYSSDLDNSTLNLFIQQDRIKWLKDLAEKYST